ncbi:Hypothetical protein SRAE_1000139400 [Strongyloides ratti]|uniref:Uncharacterized protein n=1 Tax=Strongyloides ratti TaxID=34506 RepID=A0A090L6K4_STRRB|nr:Hypothetical protein SRAE_1000139400 [Strongyloides ratti]CEF63129.1 Hypothetical protein SRAE_1000139400 [Strongyloides ratti]
MNFEGIPSMLQQVSSRFLITASAISVGAYLFYIIRKYYIYSFKKILKKENDLFTNNELLSNYLDSNDVSTASLPFNNSEIYNGEIEEEKDLLSLSYIPLHPTSFQNDGNLFSLSTTQHYTIYDEDYSKNEYNSDKDSTCSNFSCETAVGFKTPF